MGVSERPGQGHEAWLRPPRLLVAALAPQQGRELVTGGPLLGVHDSFTLGRTKRARQS
mgnify:CR=1 FL=1